jgi:hypothetical protein
MKIDNMNQQTKEEKNNRNLLIFFLFKFKLAGEQTAPDLSLQSDVQQVLVVPYSSQTSSDEKIPSHLPFTIFVVDKHFGFQRPRTSTYFLANT